MKIKCLYCNKMSDRMFGMKVPTCNEHYEEFLMEQRAYYKNKIKDDERTLMNKAKSFKLYKS